MIQGAKPALDTNSGSLEELEYSFEAGIYCSHLL